MDDLVKLENKMASKEDLKGMDIKEYLKGMVIKEDHYLELRRKIKLTINN